MALRLFPGTGPRCVPAAPQHRLSQLTPQHRQQPGCPSTLFALPAPPLPSPPCKRQKSEWVTRPCPNQAGFSPNQPPRAQCWGCGCPLALPAWGRPTYPGRCPHTQPAEVAAFPKSGLSPAWGWGGPCRTISRGTEGVPMQMWGSPTSWGGSSGVGKHHDPAHESGRHRAPQHPIPPQTLPRWGRTYRRAGRAAAAASRSRHTAPAAPSPQAAELPMPRRAPTVPSRRGWAGPAGRSRSAASSRAFSPPTPLPPPFISGTARPPQRAGPARLGPARPAQRRPPALQPRHC